MKVSSEILIIINSFFVKIYTKTGLQNGINNKKNCSTNFYHYFLLYIFELTVIQEATKVVYNKRNKNNHVTIISNTFNSATHSKKNSNNTFNRNTLKLI